MIVKNESKIIERLLNSVVDIIDFYCICDTGSTDNTKELIKNYFDDHEIKGIIFDEPFKDFGYNRTIALKKCFDEIPAADFVLLLDADMQMRVGNFDKSALLGYGDFYTILQGNSDFYYQNVRIVRNDGKYKYIGVTHEYIDRPQTAHEVHIPASVLFINDIGDGGAKSDKFTRDVRLLSKGLEDEPNNERYHFYIANSYHDNGDFVPAIKHYLRRIELGGWEQEVWYSYYRLGLSYKQIGEMEKAISAWLDGFECYKYRLENIYEIASHYRYIGKQKLSYEFIKIARGILSEIIVKNINIDEFLFLHKDVYSYKFDYEYSIISSWIGIKGISDSVVTIFNNCRDEGIVLNTLSNMKFYDFHLAADEKFTPISNDLAYKFDNGKVVNFKSSSSSILYHDGQFHANVRYVNYRIEKTTGAYFECDSDKPISDSNIISLNKYFIFDSEFNILYEKLFDQAFENRLYIGVEDLKLWMSNNSWIDFIGTGYHNSNKIGIVKGIYGLLGKKSFLTKNSLSVKEMQPVADEWSCEKNWVFIDDDVIIYNWFPLTFCESAGQKLNNLYKYNMPLLFRHVRGSTNACDLGESNLFICHIVSYESPRHYYHMFVLLKKNLTKCFFSAPFKFDNQAIEYCIGLTTDHNNVYAAYSTWDNSTTIAKYSLDKILKFCKHNFHMTIVK